MEPARPVSSCGSPRTSAPPTGSASCARRTPSRTPTALGRSPARRNWVEWAPYTTGTYTDPVENPFVALSDASTDQTVYVGQDDGAGNFDIQNVPPGDHNLAVWDEQLSCIMRFKPVHIDPGQTVDVNATGDDGSIGLGVSRWFAWLGGKVYKDQNGNGHTTRASTRRSRTPIWTSAGATDRSMSRRSPTRTVTTSSPPQRVARSAGGSSTSRASRPILGRPGCVRP
jgi:hypothetical protein